ncbi:hypothetical protein CYMTET_18132, partial [Cymbomonas tetramitiformis]
MVNMHRAIDRLVGVLARQNGSFYSKGWGDLEFWYSAERAKFDWTYPIQFGGSSLDVAESVRTASWPPSKLDLAWQPVKITPQYQILNTSFESPVPAPLFDALPALSRTAYAQLVLPPVGFPKTHNIPCVLHLPGTGDHGFARRRELALPLVHKGVASLFLEGPFHGLRRPAAQKGAKLFHVTDLLLQGRVTIEESRCLLHWMEQQGFGPMGVCGMSMGGVHASMVAALHPTSLATIPLLGELLLLPLLPLPSWATGAVRKSEVVNVIIIDIVQYMVSVITIDGEQYMVSFIAIDGEQYMVNYLIID